MAGAPPFLLYDEACHMYLTQDGGRTGERELAGRFPARAARPEDGISHVHEDLAPAFTRDCYRKLALARRWHGKTTH